MKTKTKHCCKKVYTHDEVLEEVKALRLSDPELTWKSDFCFICDGWHVVRIAPPGYMSEEAKKAIALWRKKNGTTSLAQSRGMGRIRRDAQEDQKADD